MLVVERRRLIATLFVLSLGACGGSSERDPDEDGSACTRDNDCPEGRVCADLDGNQNDTCEAGESCECAVVAPGAGGAGGAAGTGGTPTNGGTGGASDPSCREDRECREGRLCADIDGDGDGYCEQAENCQCIGVGGGGSSGASGASGGGGAGKGGSAGKGGGGSGGTPATGLGAPCIADTDCGGAPLVCLLSNGLPDRSGPPGGLCTLACTSDDECFELASSAYCVGFAEDANLNVVSYCIEGCEVGPTTAPKCDLRADFACGILDTLPATAPCSTTDDCLGGQICFEDVCQDIVTACVPTCGGNFDCASGQFCDFASGFCVPTVPGGLPIGALCDPQLSPDQDECNGFCLETDGTATQGTCAAFCSAGSDLVGCGWDGQGAAEAGCLFATVISRDSAGSITVSESDLMLCGALCDCNADCPATSDRCIDENSGSSSASIQAIFGRPGYCRPLQATETEADSFSVCP